MASIGSVQPTSLAMTTVKNIAMQMVAATGTVMSGLMNRRSKTISFAKFASDSAAPHSIDTRNSFHMTWKTSFSSRSLMDRPRMMVTDAWLPELPPVSIIMGM